MVTTMVVSESLKKAQLVLEKVTAVQEGLVNTLDQISTAVDQNKLVDMASLHSQAPSGDACQIQDLEPAACPPGSDRLEELKLEAESGQEQCEQKAAAAKETLKILDTKAKKLDAAGLASTKENHLSSKLEELKKVTEKTAEVRGHAHQIKGMDEVLEAAGVSSSLPIASKKEEYQNETELRIKKYFEALNEVSLELILQNGLPMELDKIVAILDECGAVQQIGEAAGQGRKEVQRVNDHLKKHLESVQEQRKICKKRRKASEENEKSCLAKVEKAIEILKGELGKYKDAVITNEAQIAVQTKLQIDEQAILDEINRAKDISPAADAALASCAKKAVELEQEIDTATKETAAGLNETAQLPSTLAMEGTQVALNILLRAEDQKKKQIQVTEKELAKCECDLKKLEQGTGPRNHLAQKKSEVNEKNMALQEQRMELGQVQDKKGKAEQQLESLTGLENMKYVFNKTEISRSTEEKVKKNAGDFEMFPVSQDAPEALPAVPQDSYALSIQHAQIDKMIKEEIAKQLAIQEGYHRFEKDKLEQENSELKQQVLDLLAAQRDDRSVCSQGSEISRGWELPEQEAEGEEGEEGSGASPRCLASETS